MSDGTEVSNNEVVEEIMKIVSGEYVFYGYQNVTPELKDQDFIINHHELCRLMDENQLSPGKVTKTHGKREFVQYRRITPIHLMECFCRDNEYIRVEGEQKNYYLISLLDIYTRRIIDSARCYHRVTPTKLYRRNVLHNYSKKTD